MMIAVDQHVRTEEGMEKRTGEIIGGMVYILFGMLVQFAVGNFSDRAVKIQVDELHTLTDAENWFVHFIKQIQSVKLL